MSIWWPLGGLYRGRANFENRIKDLKYDFAAGSLCMQEFWATEAALNVVMLAFNPSLSQRSTSSKGTSRPTRGLLDLLGFFLSHDAFLFSGFWRLFTVQSPAGLDEARKRNAQVLIWINMICLSFSKMQRVMRGVTL